MLLNVIEKQTFECPLYIHIQWFSMILVSKVYMYTKCKCKIRMPTCTKFVAFVLNVIGVMFLTKA